jgi:hypothetical protein
MADIAAGKDTLRPHCRYRKNELQGRTLLVLYLVKL